MTRAELLERMEREMFEPPPVPVQHIDPDTRECLMRLIELIRRALEDPE